MDGIASLKEMPEQCIIAPESIDLDSEVRVFFHGRKNRTYKILFIIELETPYSGKVLVLHVHHWARKPLTNEKLEELSADEEDRAGDE